MGDETRKEIKALTEEVVKSREELENIKRADLLQTKEIAEVKKNGTLKVLLSFFDKTKWFWLATGILIFLLAAGYGPAEIVQWVKDIASSIGIGKQNGT